MKKPSKTIKNHQKSSFKKNRIFSDFSHYSVAQDGLLTNRLSSFCLPKTQNLSKKVVWFHGKSMFWVPIPSQNLLGPWETHLGVSCHINMKISRETKKFQVFFIFFYQKIQVLQTRLAHNTMKKFSKIFFRPKIKK